MHYQLMQRVLSGMHRTTSHSYLSLRNSRCNGSPSSWLCITVLVVLLYYIL